MNDRKTARKTMTIGTGLLRLTFGLVISIFPAACGRSIETDSPAAMNAPAAAPSNSLKVTVDDYGLMTPNYYYYTDNAAFWSVQASVAESAHDPNYRCVMRIDMPKTENGVVAAAGKTFSLGDDPRHERFSGGVYVFNGHPSVYKKVEQGTISFSADSDASLSVTGAFDITITDYDSKLALKPKYRLAGEFSFTAGFSGPAKPLPAETYPTQGKEAYDRSCATCHALGEYDLTAESASELAMRGGELPVTYNAAATHHQAIELDEPSMTALRIFVNAW